MPHDYRWTTEIAKCCKEIDRLQDDLRHIEHAIGDLLHETVDLNRVEFPNREEDYVILNKVNDLWKSVANGVDQIHSGLNRACDDIVHLRRAVEMYH